MDWTTFFANWYKIVAGVCAIIVTIGWACGAINPNDISVVVGVVGVALGGQSVVSGATGLTNK